MEKILEISLYNGSSELVDLDDNLKEYLDYIEDSGNYREGDKRVWLGEEFMYIKLS